MKRLSTKGVQTKSLTLKWLMSLFIQTKPTPNPNFLKFIPEGKTVMESGTMDFVAPRFTHNSPLARKLFNIDGVKRVFYGRDYIAVSKDEGGDWNTLKPEVFSLIMEHFTGSGPLFTNEPEPEDTKINEDDPECIQMIKEILNTRVRPIVHEDGGDIVYRDFDEEKGIVYLYMKGSCSNCPSSSITLKNGIERMLVHYVPEVKQVLAEDYQGE